MTIAELIQLYKLANLLLSIQGFDRLANQTILQRQKYISTTNYKIPKFKLL